MLVEDARLVRPLAVDDGDNVIVEHNKRGVRCVVACATGDYARVTNSRHRINKWVRVKDLRVDLAPREPREE